jgi:hypothetical protein
MARQVSIRVDKARFDQVAHILVAEVRANKFPFNIMRLPQDATPEVLRKDMLTLARAVFIANLLMRGQVQSNYIFGQAMKMCVDYPELMDPEFMSQPHIDEDYVHERVVKYVKYRSFESKRIILEAQRRLKEDWGGDPRNIVKGIDDPGLPPGMGTKILHRRMVNIESINKKDRHPDQLRGIIGARPKIANLLPYFMRSVNLMDPKGKMEPAFDFHAIRTFTATGGLIFEGADPVRFEDVTRIGSQLAEAFCIENDVPTNVLADGFWWFSKTMCARAPGNRTLGRSKRKDPHKEARHTSDYKPQKREKIELKFYEPDWSKLKDVKAYELSCGRCVLDPYCTLNVSSGFYGEEGTVKTQPRTKPLPHLFHNGHGGLPHQTSGKLKPSDPVKKPKVAPPVLAGFEDLPELLKPDKKGPDT